MLYVHLSLSTTIFLLICFKSTIANGQQRRILNDLESGKASLVAIGLLHQQQVVALFGPTPISGNAIGQMTVFDSTAFAPSSDQHFVSLFGAGQLVSQAWPKLSSAFANQSIATNHLMTVVDDQQEYLFVGTPNDQKNVLYDLKKKVVIECSIKVATLKQLVSSDESKTFFEFQQSGSQYSFTKFTIKGDVANGGKSPSDKGTFCIKNTGGDAYVADYGISCKGTITFELSGGGFTDGKHFHLFTKNEVIIVPVSNAGGDDKSKVKIIKLMDYFGE